MALSTPPGFPVFINGEPASALDIRDRGLNYGHGVFETMRLADGAIPLWSLHRRRLFQGLSVLGIDLPAGRLDAELGDLLAQGGGNGLVKLMVTAGVADRGYRFSGCSRPTVIVQFGAAPPPGGTVELQVCRYRLPDNPVLAGVKHLNRLDQVLAAAELVEGREGLMLDTRSNVIESLSYNLFSRRGTLWRTPVLDRCGVSGVMRRYLMDSIFPALGLSVREMELSMDDVAGSDEVFVSNAVAGIRRVSAIAGIGDWPEGGETARIVTGLAEACPCFAA